VIGEDLKFIGPPAIIATRLQSDAEPGEIYCDERCHNSVTADELRCREDGVIVVPLERATSKEPRAPMYHVRGG